MDGGATPEPHGLAGPGAQEWMVKPMGMERLDMVRPGCQVVVRGGGSRYDPPVVSLA
ncbi:hypothetical protein GCM10009579_05170 [Streptomyces javensis]|uniref:Uncharacterized protein n=1 Tax=Streptomyces javensis TaxID=114698 RepID=A0ABP4H4T6_9ACTN